MPLIALAEAVFVIEKNKCKIPGIATLFNRVQGDARSTVYPLDFDILQTSLNLTAFPEMHDCLIVATGVNLLNKGETVHILTKGNEIVVSKLLPIIWDS